MTSPLRTDLNSFLFTSIADDANGMHLTMLSVLARSGVDPWTEAGELAALSRESAMLRLTSTLSRVPNGPTPGDETEQLASRLFALLHVSPKVASMAAGPVMGGARMRSPLNLQPHQIKWAIYSLVVVVLLVLCIRALA
jgi:hypothetical protein